MEAVYASGFVVSQDEYEVFPEAEGYLVDKLVDDGDEVKKGDILFIIGSDQQSARYRIAKEGYDMAVKNFSNNSPILNELMAATESAKNKMHFDSINVVRYSNLLKSNATTQIEYDRIKLTNSNSINDYALQKSRYEKTKNQLFLDLQNTKNQFQIASNESGRYTIRSEVDGIVFKTIKEKGELIRRNEMVAIIGKKDAFYLQLHVDELDIERIKVGQKVLAKIDAYPNKIFKAQVNKIYPLVNQQQQSFRVDATLVQNLPGQFSGLAVEANIIIHQKEKALVIPKSTLLPGDSVLINTEDGNKKIKIVKGIETMEEVEVVEGLDSSFSLVNMVNR